MTYRLHFPADVFDIYKQLPDEARQDLAVCLVDAQEDPLGHSEPYGEDDGLIRTVARGHVTACSPAPHSDSVPARTPVRWAHPRGPLGEPSPDGG
ncbi:MULTISPECIES: hypothetical protein [Streptomyces]|uniref:hypothetical protein n=1 Tax=Streptomyces TaxID=1883 RepID=UPI001CC25531|nr:hypothetical protein [Streptomyces venezuelae]